MGIGTRIGTTEAKKGRKEGRKKKKQGDGQEEIVSRMTSNAKLHDDTRNM